VALGVATPKTESRSGQLRQSAKVISHIPSLN
jgi:hypothetical protein